MYRILLADDEGIVLDSLKMIIHKNFPEEFQIETAKTGRDVIEMAEVFRPDIAFMDIQMPGINGLDAMKEIKKQNPNVIFVVLTAYDRFEYAKESANLGVFEYMNKPFTPDGIVEVLNRVIRKINSNRKKRSDDLRIREKMETVTPIIETGFVYSIMFEEFSESEVENYKQLLELDCEEGCMMVFSVGEDQHGNHMTNAVGAGVKIQKSFQKVREQIHDYWRDAVVGSIISSRIPVFLPQKKQKMDYEERISMIDKNRELARNLFKLTDCKFRIGIGSTVKLRESLRSYEEAVNALANSTGSVAHVDDLPISCQYDAEYPIDLENGLFDALKSGDADRCKHLAGEYFDWMLQNYDETNQSVRLKTLEFVLFAEHDAYLVGGMKYHFTDRADYLERVTNAERNSDLRDWFVGHFRDAASKIATKQENHENHVVAEAKNFIQKNFGNDISLDELSRILNLSPYYFSKLFKEETGATFMEYLTNLRLEKAKELLKDCNLTMKEICGEVGYSDPNYFSRIFKKNIGMTPTEYREGKCV